jgi:hypothetical protein
MKRLQNQDCLGIILFALVVIALGTTFLLQARLGERHQRLDREDRDPTVAGTTRSTLILLDVTDSLNLAQAEAVRERIRMLQEFELRHGELVSVCSVGQYADGDVYSWFRSRYPGQEVNPLIETPRRIAARRDSLFSIPLQRALGGALQPATADRTALSAAIREGAELEEFGPWIPIRRLVLASDLLENASDFSLYRVPLDSSLKPPPGWLREHRANLRGVEVEVLEIPRPRLSASARSALRAFWRDYFAACGTSSVRFRRLQ